MLWSMAGMGLFWILDWLVFVLVVIALLYVDLNWGICDFVALCDL